MKINNKKKPQRKGKNSSGSTPTLVRPTSLPSLYLSLHFSIPQFASPLSRAVPRPAVLAPRLYSGGDVKLWKELLYGHLSIHSEAAPWTSGHGFFTGKLFHYFYTSLCLTPLVIPTSCDSCFSIHLVV